MVKFLCAVNGGSCSSPTCGINESSPSLQDISAVAKAWQDSPYLFIVKVQPLLRGVEDEDIGAEQFSFAFTSKTRFLSELCEELAPPT